jgi:hypothetical protein
MLCFCCGESLVFKDLDKSRRDICGRRLEAMSIGRLKHEGSDEVMEFRLEFSRRGVLS